MALVLRQSHWAKQAEGSVQTMESRLKSEGFVQKIDSTTTQDFTWCCRDALFWNT